MSFIAGLVGLTNNFIPTVEYVGGAISGSTGNGGAITLDISSIDIQAGDLIIGIHGAGSPVTIVNMSLSSTGYSYITGIYANDSRDANLEVYGKIADGTETSFATNATGNNLNSTIAAVRVYRGPLSVPEAHASGSITNTDDITWPTVSGTVSKEMLVYIGATGHNSGSSSTYADPSDLTDFVDGGTNDTFDLTLGMGNKAITTETSFSASKWNTATNGTSSANAYVILKLSSA